MHDHLKQIACVCFSVLIVAGLFFASPSDGFAQGNPLLTVRGYEELVQGYQSQGLRIPKNETEHQEISGDEGILNRYYTAKLKETYLATDEFFTLKRGNCNDKFLPKDKRKCVAAADAALQKNDTKYLAALVRVNQIWNDRKRSLNEARKKFTPSQMTRTPRKRIYERKVDEKIIQQTRRKYQRRVS